MSKVMTPAELAVEFDSTGREVRKFLRKITAKDEQPGKGSRWSIPANARELKSLRKQFDEWVAEKAPAEDEVAEDATTEVEGIEDELDA